MLFHGNNAHANAHQYYVIRTVHCLSCKLFVIPKVRINPFDVWHMMTVVSFLALFVVSVLCHKLVHHGQWYVGERSCSPEHWLTLPSGNSWQTSACDLQTRPVYSQCKTGKRNRRVSNLHLWTMYYLSIVTRRFAWRVTHTTIFSLTANERWWVCKHGTSDSVVSALMRTWC